MADRELLAAIRHEIAESPFVGEGHRKIPHPRPSPRASHPSDHDGMIVTFTNNVSGEPGPAQVSASRRGFPPRSRPSPEGDWQPLDDYPDDGEAQIAQTMVSDQRLVVRRTRLLGPQAELWLDWRHFAFLTNRTDPLEVVEAEHRQHAVVELAIRDLKDQALAHFPSGKFTANAAWTVIACLAHNLLRWTTVIGLPGTTIRVARTIRRRLLTLPGRLTRTARQWTLHLPARWPWQHDFTAALTRLRSLPAPD